MEIKEALPLAATLLSGRLASMEGDGYVSDKEIAKALFDLANAIVEEANGRKVQPPKISADAFAKANGL
ncbi:hypothetical protein [Chromobacterium haemolyticum]|uniref:hypothetical protein n=1 Tax=Chromobacterium haemolyticum TaxID=394935 RepID=UPI001374ABD1|nr:hypothetical protein [Chromobacterium haemolyticum]